MGQVTPYLVSLAPLQLLGMGWLRSEDVPTATAWSSSDVPNPVGLRTVGTPVDTATGLFWKWAFRAVTTYLARSKARKCCAQMEGFQRNQQAVPLRPGSTLGVQDPVQDPSITEELPQYSH